MYVEHHRTLGDRVRDVVAAGFRLVDLVEPEWPAWNTPGVGRLVPAAREPDPGDGDLRVRAGVSSTRAGGCHSLRIVRLFVRPPWRPVRLRGPGHEGSESG